MHTACIAADVCERIQRRMLALEILYNEANSDFLSTYRSETEKITERRGG